MSNLRRIVVLLAAAVLLALPPAGMAIHVFDHARLYNSNSPEADEMDFTEAVVEQEEDTVVIVITTANGTVEHTFYTDTERELQRHIMRIAYPDGEDGFDEQVALWRSVALLYLATQPDEDFDTVKQWVNALTESVFETGSGFMEIEGHSYSIIVLTQEGTTTQVFEYSPAKEQ